MKKKFIPFAEKTKKNEERKTHDLKKKQQLLLKSRLLYDITANFIWQVLKQSLKKQKQ